MGSPSSFLVRSSTKYLTWMGSTYLIKRESTNYLARKGSTTKDRMDYNYLATFFFFLFQAVSWIDLPNCKQLGQSIPWCGFPGSLESCSLNFHDILRLLLHDFQ